MVNEYKHIVLLKGLELISSHYFSIFKSLMATDLKLERHLQEEYTTVQIADRMEDTFQADAGLDKLIRFCEEVPALQKRAEMLKEERSKVKGKTPLKKKKKEEAVFAIPTLTTSHTLASEGGETSTAQKRQSMSKEKNGVKKTKGSEGPDDPLCPEETAAMCQSPVPQNSSSASSNTSLVKMQESQTANQSIARGAVLQRDPMTVVVLQATKPFEYESSEHEKKTMFHATVATVNEYFHVKVFNVDLKEKFTKNNVIKISNYVKNKGILEINEDSSVSEADPGLKIKVPNSLIKREKESANISAIRKSPSGRKLFYCEVTLQKKNVKLKNTIYEVEDGSGNIEVVGNGKWHNIICEEGDKLQLFCFQLKTIDKQPKLVCGDHSFIKVTKPRKKKKAATAHSNIKDEDEKEVFNRQDQFSAFKEEKPNTLF